MVCPRWAELIALLERLVFCAYGLSESWLAQTGSMPDFHRDIFRVVDVRCTASQLPLCGFETDHCHP